MSFAHPWVLALLVIPLALGVCAWRRYGRRVVLPFDHGAPTTGRGWRWVLNVAESLPAVLFGIVIVILAGPQQLSEPRTKRVMTNIEFCVDVSGSMTAPFGDGTRYDASLKAIDDFLEVRQGDAYGLTFFGNSVLHWVPLTSDTSAIRCSPPFMRPENIPPWFGGTEIARALLACQELLVRRPEGDRMIILVSDGFSFDLINGNDETLARDLKRHGIVVYAIHTADTAVPDPIVNITAYTGGEAFAAGDPESLRAVYERIDKMQPTKLEKTAAETMDNFVPFCLAGLSALGTGILALFGLRYTPW
jgi:Ca-activated chloride channel family protein